MVHCRRQSRLATVVLRGIVDTSSRVALLFHQVSCKHSEGAKHESRITDTEMQGLITLLKGAYSLFEILAPPVSGVRPKMLSLWVSC